MEPCTLFSLAAHHSAWLAVRQSAIASNVANANTAGYAAVDVEPFEKVLDQTRVKMAATQVGHIRGGATEDGIAVKPEDGGLSLKQSGEPIQLESELMKAGEVRRAYELNTAIVKAFHRMTMLALKV